MANLIRRDHASAHNDLKMAISINPNSAFSHITFGMYHDWSDQPDEALSYFDEAERLSPKDPMMWLLLMGRSIAHLLTGEIEQAAVVGKRSVAYPNAPTIAYLIYAAVLGHLNRSEETGAAIESALRVNPKFSVKFADQVLPTNVQRVRDSILDGLRKAGAPDG